VRFVLTSDVNEFADQTRALLASRLECNLHATVLQHAISRQYTSAVLAYGVNAEEQVVFAALRTPPWLMLATELEPGAASALIERWLEVDPDLPGVNSQPETARAIALAWSEQTGGTTRCQRREGMHVLDEVRSPLRHTPGKLRLPRGDERALLIEWMRGFASEVGAIPLDQVETVVQGPLDRDALFVWDDNGPVSMLVVSPPVSDVVRIGPVYTPPGHRCRGYATSMVAAASRQALAEGAMRCMLFTDLANPTSNKIYAEVGYRRVGDVEEHAFERE
jgi:uncharacterized protein